MQKLTTANYWNGTYAQAGTAPLEITGFRDLAQHRTLELIESVPLDGKRVLELGAGNSAVLCYLARRHSNATFAGLDYAEAGCSMLRARAEREQAEVEVIQGDLFDPPIKEQGAYDVVFSLGLVEHFTDLATVLRAKRQFLRPGGTMITVIPNMAGAVGRLTRRYNPRVFALHVPHRPPALVAGHLAAGLTVDRHGYLCSTNFGVLSSCFEGPRQKGWKTYLWLARITTALWFFEWHFFNLPRTALFSPYLFVVARRD